MEASTMTTQAESQVEYKAFLALPKKFHNKLEVAIKVIFAIMMHAGVRPSDIEPIKRKDGSFSSLKFTFKAINPEDEESLAQAWASGGLQVQDRFDTEWTWKITPFQDDPPKKSKVVFRFKPLES